MKGISSKNEKWPWLYGPSNMQMLRVIPFWSFKAERQEDKQLKSWDSRSVISLFNRWKYIGCLLFGSIISLGAMAGKFDSSLQCRNVPLHSATAVTLSAFCTYKITRFAQLLLFLLDIPLSLTKKLSWRPGNWDLGA